MGLALLESRLALAERHIVESRDQILRQKLIVGDLEDTRRNSVTALAARKLLELLQKELEQHIADRDKLRRWLERRDIKPTTAILSSTNSVDRHNSV